MTAAARLRALWRNLLHRGRAERDLAEEVEAYAALLEEEKVAQGMPREQARRAAAVEMGGREQVAEAVREVRMGALLETVAQDARYGLRSLRRSPGFTAAAVTALALGIGATTAIFSVVDAVLLRPLPYARPHELALVAHRSIDPVAAANFLDWRREAASFARMGAAQYWEPNLTGGDHPEKVLGLRMTADVIPLLGVAPLLGRSFTPDEEQRGREHEVVLGYRIWQRRYAGDPGVVGRTVRLDGESYAVIGVMPPGFEFPPFWAVGAQLWAPLPLADQADNRWAQSLRVFARLRPEATLSDARAEMGLITARLEEQHPATNREVVVRPLGDVVVGGTRRALYVLLGAVGFVLLIACANVSHMLLARGSAREKEVALRAALGASRARVARQLVTESVVLALLGGGAGLLLAAAAVRALTAFGPAGIPRLATANVNGRVLAATTVVSLVTGIAFGLLPALQAARRDLTEALREGERGTTGGARRSALRRVLMGSEVALALVLLIGAGLMVRSFVALRGLDPGFRPDHVLTAIVSVTGTREAAPGQRVAFYSDLLARLSVLPGVAAAGAINSLPLAGDNWGEPFYVEGRPRPAHGECPIATYRAVLPGYFRAAGLALVRGRDFTEADALDAPEVGIVNQYLAARWWPGQDPIGKRLTFDRLDGTPRWFTVVGVARDAARSDWAAAPGEEMYLPYLQSRDFLDNPRSIYTYLSLVVRTTGEPAALAPALRSTVWSIDPAVTVASVMTMDDVVAHSTASPRFYLLLLGSFAAAALALAAVGIYGMMAYAVARRRNEIGIRMALGARPADVLRLVMGEAATVTGAGMAAGLAGALALTRLMSSLLYGVGATDPATFAAVCAVLAAVALSATWLPARRAIGGNPLAALRSE